MASAQQTIASRFLQLNQLILGKSNQNIPNKSVVHRDGLLDVFFALYEECNVDYLRKNKYLAAFVDKYRGLMCELKLMRVNVKDFECKKIIGRGHFGEVQVVREKATGNVYAMKVLRKEEILSQQNIAFYEEERDIMAKSNSPWITKLQYAFQDSQNLYLIMEFLPGGDMLCLLEKFTVLPEDVCCFYLAELVLAIHSVHSMGYIHRDIKPDNVLIDRTGHIKLADFGSACKINHSRQITSNMPVGTPDYIAPEVLSALNHGASSGKCGIECDWWSLGVLTFEMLFGYTPFGHEKVPVTYNNIMNFKKSLKFPPESNKVSAELIEIIRNLLQDSNNRWGYSKLVEHELFRNVDWNNIQHTAPPYVPTVTSVDDTSNFNDFEPENRPCWGDLKYSREFIGKNLPFVGFTYISPFEAVVERLSSSHNSISSPLLSAEIDLNPKRQELQNKILELSASEDSLMNEMNNLKAELALKDKKLDESKNEIKVLTALSDELKVYAKEQKQLLFYESKYREIMKQRAIMYIRCQQSKIRESAIRLRAKREYDEEQNSPEKQPTETGTEENDEPQDSLETKLKMLQYEENAIETENEKYELKLLVAKLERRISQLEKELNEETSKQISEDVTSVDHVATPCDKASNEMAIASENFEKDLQLHELRKALLNEQEKSLILTNQLKSLSKNLHDESTVKANLEEKVKYLEGKETNLGKEIEILKKMCDNLEQQVSAEKSPFQRSKSQSCVTEKIEFQSSFARSSELNKKNENLKTQVEVRSIEINTSILEDALNSASSSTLEQENRRLKTKIETLSSEIANLKEESFNKTTRCSDMRKQLKEKENELMDAKSDLRISKREQEQLGRSNTYLRESNKELREKVTAAEKKLYEKSNSSDELRSKINTLENELSEKQREVIENDKKCEIQKAKLEERVKAMQDTCKMSGDINQRFARSQGQYEEIVKQNENLKNECDEKTQKMLKLIEEVKSLKNQLYSKQNECSKYERTNLTLKMQCTEMDNQMSEFESLVETQGRTLSKTMDENEHVKKDQQRLKNDLNAANFCLNKEKKLREELELQVEELSSELDNQQSIYEKEAEEVQDHYEKINAELREQISELEKELASYSRNAKSYSQSTVALEEQLVQIKEEATKYITQISSLKQSNLKLTQALDDALYNQKEARVTIDELCNAIESEKANHALESLKFQETIAQQTKLIDFLQSKTEDMERKKRPNLARFFGKKENNSNALPGQFREVENLLEKERSRSRRLQDQLSQSRAENFSLQRDINNLRTQSLMNSEVPVSPTTRAIHKAITFSPSAEANKSSPTIISQDYLNKIKKPPGMKHKIPHRFAEMLCMRGIKCNACLGSVHFGRPAARCQECSVVCHPKCATSLPSTCGLPSGFLQHFKSAVRECPSTSASGANSEVSEGWVKIPKSSKQGWDRKYLRVIDDTLCFFESEDVCDPKQVSLQFDFNHSEANIIVTSAVSHAELTYAANSDLPYVLKIECQPHTTCWPQRCLYIMTSNFNDKQMWVSTLEALAEKYQGKVNGFQKNKLTGHTILELKGEKCLNALCTLLIDDDLMLLGAMEGLYVFDVICDLSSALRCKIDGVDKIYQMELIKHLGYIILIEGKNMKLTLIEVSSLQSYIDELTDDPVDFKSIDDIIDCHLFALQDGNFNETPYLCVATPDTVTLYRWSCSTKTFCKRKVIETSEPCSCIHFTLHSVIYGADRFYELDLKTFTVKEFLDSSDGSLGGLLYEVAAFRSFPIAILQVSPSNVSEEYLLCFHELGVFVDGMGRRTRKDDMKWSRLPLSFAYQMPYLFVTHFNSIEVVQILIHGTSNIGARAVMLVPNPQFLGPAATSGAIYISSRHDHKIEIITVEGKSFSSGESSQQDASSQLSQENEDDFVTQSSSSPTSSIIVESSNGENEGADFSFSASINQSLEEQSVDILSMLSGAPESESSQSSR